MEENLEKQFINQIKTYVKMYEQKSITKNQLKDFCGVMVEYCKQKRHSQCSLKTPALNFGNLERDTVHGEYAGEKNTITINEAYLDQVLSGEYQIANLINTIGHEMEHYEQNSSGIDYDNMSTERQQAVDNESKKSIDAYKNYAKLSKDDVRFLHDNLAPYLKENEMPNGYKSLEDFYSDVSYASYNTILSEQDARKEGVNFSLSVLNELGKDSQSSSWLSIFNIFKSDADQNKIKSWFISKQKSNQEYVKSRENFSTNRNESIINNFEKIYTADDNTILQIAKDFESKGGKLDKTNSSQYSSSLKFLIKNKSIEQRKSLLQNAIYNGYSSLARVIVNSLGNDIDLKQNRDSISNLVSDCFSGEAYGKQKVRLDYKSYFADYSKIMSPDQYENLIANTLENNDYKAKSLITFSKYTNFSTESILKYQEILKRKRLKNSVFSNALMSQTNIQKKIELLESGKINKENFALLEKYIKEDNQYSQYAGIIEPLLEENKKRLSRRINVFGNEQNTQKKDDKILTLYSKYMANYYDESNTAKNPEEFKRVNDKMMDYLESKNKSIASSTEMSDQEIAQLGSGVFSNEDIQSLKNNKRAMKKLAYILSSGLYKKGGESVELSLNQKTCLAKLLATTNDLELNGEKKVDLSAVAKQFGKATGKVNEEGQSLGD